MNYRRKLFKYIDAEGAMRMLSNATLQFTNPCDFNDPFDCHPSLIDFSLGTSQRYGEVDFTRYNEFLEKRRMLMTEKIKKYYYSL